MKYDEKVYGNLELTAALIRIENLLFQRRELFDFRVRDFKYFFLIKIYFANLKNLFTNKLHNFLGYFSEVKIPIIMVNSKC